MDHKNVLIVATTVLLADWLAPGMVAFELQMLALHMENVSSRGAQYRPNPKTG